jgi:hypothetical protein
MIFLDFRLKSVRQTTDFTTDGAHTPKTCRKRGADEGKKEERGIDAIDIKRSSIESIEGYRHYRAVLR